LIYFAFGFLPRFLGRGGSTISGLTTDFGATGFLIFLDTAFTASLTSSTLTTSSLFTSATSLSFLISLSFFVSLFLASLTSSTLTTPSLFTSANFFTRFDAVLTISTVSSICVG
jgi:hypothetical protein